MSPPRLPSHLHAHPSAVPYVDNEAWTSRVGKALGVVEAWRPWLWQEQVAGCVCRAVRRNGGGGGGGGGGRGILSVCRYVTSYASNFKFVTVKVSLGLVLGMGKANSTPPATPTFPRAPATWSPSSNARLDWGCSPTLSSIRTGSLLSSSASQCACHAEARAKVYARGRARWELSRAMYVLHFVPFVMRTSSGARE